MSPTDNPVGSATPTAGASDYSALMFVLRQFMANVRTATLVQVTAVSNDGGVSPVGNVSVRPLVGQVDGDGNVTPHGVIHGIPYFRLQGGTNAVILDPVVGDIGLAVFADRDISAVVASGKPSPPGSLRRNHFSDGLYIGGFLNGTPVQYVQFTDSGITVRSPTLVTIDAPSAKTTGNLEVGQDLIVDGSTSLKAVTSNGVNISSTHVHGGVTTGSGNSAVPH